jgi:hypothetical protein
VSDAQPAATDAAEPGPSREWWRIDLLVRQNWRHVDLHELSIIVSLLALCVLVKVLWLTPINIFTDAGEKWHFVRQWSYSNDIQHGTWSHHGARLGVNVPVYFIQKIFGTHPTAYYVAPIAGFTLQILFVYLIARRLSGRLAGVLASLLLIFFPGLTPTVAQLLPDGFGGTAAIIVAYLLIRFEEETGRKRLYWLLAAGFGCFYTYWIKESDVLLWPGVVVAVWLSKRSFREAGIVIAVMLGFVLLETACFSLLTKYTHRLAIVQGVEGWYEPIKFMDLFKRFTKLDTSWQILVWMWVPSMLWLAGSNDKRARPLVLMALSFVFLLTFMVRSINPIVQWTAFKPRYFAVAAPFFGVTVGMFCSEMLSRIWQQYVGLRFQRLAEHFKRWGAPWTAGLCLALGAGLYMLAKDGLDKNPLAELGNETRILNDAYQRNLPIVESHNKHRGLNTIAQIYLKPRLLVQPDGRLPNIEEVVQSGRSHGSALWYVLRDPAAYKGDDLAELVDKGCAVVIKAKVKVNLNVKQKLPERCRAPRGKRIAR